MLNKFIFSGIVEAVDEEKNFIAFSVPTPNTGNMLLNMSFDKKIVENVAKAYDNTNVILTVEGFVFPGENGGINLSVQTVSTSTIPNKQINKA